MNFRKAKWIWRKDCTGGNDYVDFSGEFFLGEGACRFAVCASTNYILFLNGKFAATSQYEYFDGYDTAESLDVTSLCVRGQNRFLLRVNLRRYSEERKGVIFEFSGGEEILFASDGNTRCRRSSVYRSGGSEWVGNGFCFVPYIDLEVPAEGEEPAWGAADLVSPAKSFAERPIAKLETGGLKPAALLEESSFRYRGGGSLGEILMKAELCRDGEGEYLLYDLGEETVGYLEFEVSAVAPCEMRIGYGEHLQDGRPRTVCGVRNYALSVRLGSGTVRFCEYFWRIGLRYLCVFLPHTARIREIGIRPVTYPLREKPFIPADDELRKIYETGIHTLRCCMHEHYEDCPMREQAMYTMDSRTQMLCGYEAFEETEFQRAALKLMSQKLRPDVNLYLMQPGDHPLYIPTYTLVYFLALRDYFRYTQDGGLIREVFPKLQKIIEHYLSLIKENGLLDRFGPPDVAWHFYSWEKGLVNMWGDNSLPQGSTEYPFLLNCFMALALDCHAEFCRLCGSEEEGARAMERAQKIREAARALFWSEEEGLFSSYVRDGVRWHYCELSQVMAIYCQVAEREQRDLLLGKLMSENALVPLSLNDMLFKYEVLLQAGQRGYVEQDIRKRWGRMLAQGATSFWETEKGADDFDGAASLCHGWSASPVWCLRKMLSEGELKKPKGRTRGNEFDKEREISGDDRAGKDR